MTVTLAQKTSTGSKTEFIDRLNALADQLMKVGWTEEADRAREIAKEVRALSADDRPSRA
ncbi:MAG TPA: hypothetical protein VJT32_09855 [bacterium]|nr:hypothetical protein [bacterium]